LIRKKFLLTFLILLLTSHAKAESTQYQMRGYLFARLSHYTEDAKNYGQQTRGQLEQTAAFTSSFSAMNQLRWNANSISADLSKTNLSKKESFEVYLGENFLKYKSEHWVAQLGYQEVVWGEAFGFNYADVISPKDLRETLYSDADIARRPLLLANLKTLFSIGDLSGSLQFLYSPEPRFSKTLPIEVYAGEIVPNITFNVTKEKTPKLFSETEFGGKASLSYAGLDLSLFGFSYLDRDPHYVLDSATLTTINVHEEHNKVKSTGAALSKTIGDFVFRTDVVLTKDKMVNYIDGNLLRFYPTDFFNYVVSIDSPTYNDYSGVLIFASSTIKEIFPLSFREKNEKYLIGKLTKNLGADKTFELSYTHELEHTGRTVQSFINWPINSTTDLKLGGQFYSGNEESNLNKYKNISSIFFSLKNYFQL